MGGRASRQKGMRGEYGLRDYFRARGWKSDRVPSSGAAEGFKGDVVLEKEGKRLVAELKVRESEFKSIYAKFHQGMTDYGCVVRDLGAMGAVLSYDFDKIGYTPGSPLQMLALRTDILDRTDKKLLGLHKFVKTCDFLVIKIDRRPFIFIRYYAR